MPSTHTTRRRFLEIGGAAALFGLAGCTSDATNDGGESETETTTTKETSATTQTTAAPATERAAANASEPATETEVEVLTPHDTGSVHFHGYLTFAVNGERVDFDETRYYQKNTGNEIFYFHETKNDNLTHVHAKDVTVYYALNSLPGITIGKTSTVEIGGRTYSTADPGTTITITVENTPVDPRTYVLKEHDHIEVLIRISGANAPSNSTNATSTTNPTSTTNTTNATNTTGTAESHQ